MHPEERGLLDAIIANPADDTPRLILADWLEDDGRGERAELIRVQIVLAAHERADKFPAPRPDARLPPGYLLPSERLPLQQRERELLSSMRDPIFVDWPSPCLQWRRGFIRDAKCPITAWTRHGPALCGLHPVEAVEITNRRPSAGAWYRGDGHGSFALPPAIWDLMPYGGNDDHWKDYPTEAEAVAVFRAAALAWAKGEAAKARRPLVTLSPASDSSPTSTTRPARRTA